VEAGNIGDGSMALTVSSSVSWLVATVGAQRNCGTMSAAQCFPINLTLNTGSLPAGLTTGVVSIGASSSTIDAPQTLTVTVQMGGPLPKGVDVTIGQGKTTDIKFYTNKYLSPNQTTSGANWVAVVLDGVGSFQFGVPYHLHIAPSSNMAVSTYNTTVTLGGSSDPIDNTKIPVTMHVTDQPVAVPSTDAVQKRIAQGAPPILGVVTLDNIGLGTLSVSAVKVNNAAWLQATPSGAGAILTYDVTSLSPGTYTGSVTLTSNSVTPVPDIPVVLTVVAKGAPVISFNGVVDNAIFGAGDALTSGDIGVVLGEQLSFATSSSSTAPTTVGPVTSGPAPPLATTIGTTQVLVNGSPAPLYYISYGQLAFQVPFDLTPETDVTVQVIRDGQASNTVSVHIKARAPRLLLVGGSPYGAIVNQDGSLPMPAGLFPGVNTHPAQVGDTLTIYAIGLGATNPGVTTGAPAPSSEPLSRLTSTPTVNFYLNGAVAVSAQPFFAGLTPTYAGLYQVNVTIPPNAPKGSSVNVTLVFNDSVSNAAQIAIQ
jgi:uncharacterized protein (TIGR03437 family)